MNVDVLDNESVYDSTCVGRCIRLFGVAPGHGNESLKLSMRYQNLKPSSAFMQEPNEEHSTYTAISYTWGDPEDTIPVTCNGYRMNTTRTLHGALWRLREKGYRGQIWADAICIDQRNLAEKTTQIRLMGDIYQQAEQVFIWLGEEEENDEKGLNLMSFINASVERYVPGVTVRPTPDFSLDVQGLTQIPADYWAGLISILQRPWFWRAWVVQEYLQARDAVFQCGRFEIPSSVINGVLDRIGNNHELKFVAQMKGSKFQNRSSSSLLGPVFEFNDVSVGKIPLTGLLSRARGLQSSEPKDRLFALVGLSSDTSTDLIDYVRDFNDVLREITREKLQILLDSPDPSAVFEYLSYTSENDCAPGRSSWAPFFELPAPFRSIDSLFAMKNSMETVPGVDVTDSKVLRLNGRIIDRVCKIIYEKAWSNPAVEVSRETATQAAAEWREVLSAYKNVWQLISSMQQYPNGESLHEVFWRSLIFNTEDEHIKAGPHMAECLQANRESLAVTTLWFEHEVGLRYLESSVEEVVQEIRDLAPDMKWTPSPQAMAGVGTSIWSEMKDYVIMSHESISIWAKAIALLTWGRSYFASELGYVGWVPEHAQDGDLICAFDGSRFPFVVRPYQEGFRLIGACYMHGIMEGEAIELPRKTGFNETQICLV